MDEIRALCFQLAPSKIILDKIRALPSWPSEQCQDTLVAECLCSNHQELFPPPKTWLRTLLKAIDKELQNQILEGTADVALSDAMADVLVQTSNSEGDVGYVTYFNDCKASNTVFRVVKG